MTTQMLETQGSQIDGDLVLVPIDDRSWRLCDQRWPASDAPHVVAYIELVDDAYDVVWMRGTRRRSRLQSLGDCLRAAGAHLAQDIVPGTRPITIAAFPPPRSA